MDLWEGCAGSNGENVQGFAHRRGEHQWGRRRVTRGYLTPLVTSPNQERSESNCENGSLRVGLLGGPGADDHRFRLQEFRLRFAVGLAENGGVGFEEPSEGKFGGRRS